jgi:hypothetical protein
MNVTGYSRVVSKEMKYRDWEREIAKIKAVPYPMDVDIAAGDVERFAAAIDRQIGFNRREPADGAASICGVPIRHSDLLPANMACLMVNGQVMQLIKFDAP